VTGAEGCRALLAARGARPRPAPVAGLGGTCTCTTSNIPPEGSQEPQFQTDCYCYCYCFWPPLLVSVCCYYYCCSTVTPATPPPLIRLTSFLRAQKHKEATGACCCASSPMTSSCSSPPWQPSIPRSETASPSSCLLSVLSLALSLQQRTTRTGAIGSESPQHPVPREDVQVLAWHGVTHGQRAVSAAHKSGLTCETSSEVASSMKITAGCLQRATPTRARTELPALANLHGSSARWWRP